MHSLVLGLLVLSAFVGWFLVSGVVLLTIQALRAAALGAVGLAGIAFVGVVYVYSELRWLLNNLLTSPA